MRVGVILEKGESPEEAEELLFKALSSQRNGNIHSHEFPDSAMEAVAQNLSKKYEDAFKDMLLEIQEVLDGVE